MANGDQYNFNSLHNKVFGILTLWPRRELVPNYIFGRLILYFSYAFYQKKNNTYLGISILI